jgi:hypothetical protein
VGGSRRATSASDGDSQGEARADHPDTLTSMASLAFTWKEQGKTAKAIRLMRECVQRRQCVLGVNHPRFISSSGVLAEWEAEGAEITSSAASVAKRDH